MANAEAETVDFEPEDDDLMDEDVDTPSSPRAPIPRIKSLVTGGSSSAPRKTKGRGFREDAAEADRNARMSARFDSLDSDGGPGPERWCCEAVYSSDYKVLPELASPFSGEAKPPGVA
nr:RNA-binding protein 8A-like [Ipomoea batatas]